MVLYKDERSSGWPFTPIDPNLGSNISREKKPRDLGCDFQDEVEANTCHGELQSRYQVG